MALGLRVGLRLAELVALKSCGLSTRWGPESASRFRGRNAQAQRPLALGLRVDLRLAELVALKSCGLSARWGPESASRFRGRNAQAQRLLALGLRVGLRLAEFSCGKIPGARLTEGFVFPPLRSGKTESGAHVAGFDWTGGSSIISGESITPIHWAGCFDCLT